MKVSEKIKKVVYYISQDLEQYQTSQIAFTMQKCSWCNVIVTDASDCWRQMMLMFPVKHIHHTYNTT